jgi:cytochrome P450
VVRAEGWQRCREALLDEGFASDPRRAGVAWAPPNNLLFMDGDLHRQLRRLVMPYFTTHRCAALERQLEEGCQASIESVFNGPALDLVTDLAEPLVLEAIFTAMEVPPGRRAKLGALAREMLGLLEPDLSLPARRRAANAAIRATMVFRQDRLDGRAAGLHAALQGAAEAGEIPGKLASSTPVVVLHGGYENPLNQLGCVIAWAVEDPPRFKRAVGEAPDLLFEEILRVCSPVRRVARWREKELVWVDLESANRDRHRFIRPDQVDLSTRRQHLGFGYGLHACLGTALARLQGRVLIRALATLPDEALRGFTVEWGEGAVARGPARIVRG